MPTPLPVIAQTFRCALKWEHSGSGQTAVNVIHVRGTVGVLDQPRVFASIDSAVTAGMWDSMQTLASVIAVDVTPLDGSGSTLTFPTGSPAKWTGAATGDFNPAVAALVKLQTGTRGRDNRGRIFLPFISEGETLAGAWNPSGLATAQAAWSGFQGRLAAATNPIELVVASYDRRHGGAGAHATTVLTATCEPMLGTIRGRQERVR